MAAFVGPRTLQKAMKSSGYLIVAVLLSITARSYGDARLSTLGKTENNGCTAVKSAYITKGLSTYDNSDIPTSPVSVTGVPLSGEFVYVDCWAIPGWHLRICQQGSTCCTKEMELKLNTQSQQDFDEIMAKKINLLRESFISRTAKFDVFFTELLDNAKRDLHEMFVRTYGLLYQQNSRVFIDLFHDLKSYYKGRDINLLDALDNFFSTLLQKMFELLNSQYTFDDAYMQCVTEHMDELKPFGDVPSKLAVQRATQIPETVPAQNRVLLAVLWHQALAEFFD
ncbi:hypothetical protein LSH36_189g03063 [Paralvinella palmiformis]|uniref:Uncharacterized protein n=1 Tax=Paralvinella palmiformis TaxID=53620 RepID=A0AAD9JRZ2_9ANNE|nr:hypothetical protein LSH36_189g03063 [Paralvinella palmiformis]